MCLALSLFLSLSHTHTHSLSSILSLPSRPEQRLLILSHPECRGGIKLINRGIFIFFTTTKGSRKEQGEETVRKNHYRDFFFHFFSLIELRNTCQPVLALDFFSQHSVRCSLFGIVHFSFTLRKFTESNNNGCWNADAPA